MSHSIKNSQRNHAHHCFIASLSLTRKLGYYGYIGDFFSLFSVFPLCFFPLHQGHCLRSYNKLEKISEVLKKQDGTSKREVLHKQAKDDWQTVRERKEMTSQK